MANGLLGIASSGLMAFQRSLATISHNIANVDTEGYSRQTAELSARQPDYIGTAGFMGTGVDVKAIRRSYDTFLTAQVRTSTSAHADLDAFYTLASRVDNFIADQDSSLPPVMQAFFNSIQGVANEPTSISVRSAMLTSAQSLVNRFGAINENLDNLRNQANQSITDSVSQLNSLAENLAELNRKIFSTQGLAGGNPPNDLLDQRDQLLLEMAEHLDVQVVTQSDGTANVFVGSGQALVMGTEANSLKVQDSPYGGAQKDVVLYAKGSSNATIITDKLSGGDIGGLMSFQKEFLDPVQNDLGRIAAAFSAQFNNQHKLGFDLDGNAGVDFFQAPRTTVFGRATNSVGATLAADFSDFQALTGGDYEVEVTATGANVTNLRTKSLTSYAFATPPGTFSHEGLGFTLAGAAAGDRFLVQPTRNVAGDMGMAAGMNDPAKIAASASARAGDNGNALALANMQNAKNLANGRASYQEAYNEIVGAVGNLTKSAEINAAAQKSLLDHAVAQRESVAGVNLDEEAANLIQFQQAYQAAAQMIVAAQTTFASLIGAVRT